MSADVRTAPMLLVLAAAASCTTFTGPSSTDESWAVHETAHFLLYVRPASFASQHVQTFGDILEDQRGVSLARLDAGFDSRMHGFFYEPGQGGLRSAHEGVAYPLNSTFTLAATPPLDGNLFVLMSHEANHVIVEQVLGRPGTSFVNEGIASALLSEQYHQLGPTFLHGWVGARQNLPLPSELVDDGAWDRADHDQKYNVSASFLAYLLDAHGPGPFKQIYGASSKSFAAAFEAAYGVSLAAMEQRWQQFVGSRTTLR